MKKSTRILIAVPVVLFTVACASMAAMMAGTEKPAASEFGYGPRASASGNYSVRIEESAKYPQHKILSTTFVVTDKAGRAVDDLTIAVDGGMPQHRHGLPTRPVASKSAGAGQYRIDGLKFSMGGWWVLKLKLQSAAGPDSVVFNLDL